MTDNDTARLEGKVDAATNLIAEMKGMLSALLPGIEARQTDHETRLRKLERFRYSVPSIAFLSLLVSLAVLAYYVTQGAH